MHLFTTIHTLITSHSLPCEEARSEECKLANYHNFHCFTKQTGCGTKLVWILPHIVVQNSSLQWLPERWNYSNIINKTPWKAHILPTLFCNYTLLTVLQNILIQNLEESGLIKETLSYYTIHVPYVDQLDVFIKFVLSV